MVRSMIVRFENLNSTHFEPRMMDLINQPTFKDHISKMSQPGCWGTHIEIMAIASMYQVPVFFCADPPQSSSHKWEVVYPVAQASKLKYPLTVEDDPTHLCSLAKPTHFELVYYTNTHYDCIVSIETALLCSTMPVLTNLSDTTIIDLSEQLYSSL